MMPPAKAVTASPLDKLPERGGYYRMNRIIRYVDDALEAGVRPDELLHALVTAIQDREDRRRARFLLGDLRGYQGRRLRSWLEAHRPPEWRPCARCGESFAASRSDALYCSTRCRVAAKRLRDGGSGISVTAG